jgi:hypothetical protein
MPGNGTVYDFSDERGHDDQAVTLERVALPDVACGVTVDELADRARVRRGVLVEVLDEELRRGRVVRDAGGRYAIVLDRFPPETIEALRQLRPVGVDDRSRFARPGRRREGASWLR